MAFTPYTRTKGSSGVNRTPPRRVVLTNDDGPDSAFFKTWVPAIKEITGFVSQSPCSCLVHLQLVLRSAAGTAAAAKKFCQLHHEKLYPFDPGYLLF